MNIRSFLGEHKRRILLNSGESSFDFEGEVFKLLLCVPMDDISGRIEVITSVLLKAPDPSRYVDRCNALLMKEVSRNCDSCLMDQCSSCTKKEKIYIPLDNHQYAVKWTCDKHWKDKPVYWYEKDEWGWKFDEYEPEYKPLYDSKYVIQEKSE